MIETFNEYRFVSLDNDLHCCNALLSFSQKRSMFARSGCFFYIMHGIVRVPEDGPVSDDSRVIYGVEKGRTYALSRDVKKLIEWAEAD